MVGIEFFEKVDVGLGGGCCFEGFLYVLFVCFL